MDESEVARRLTAVLQDCFDRDDIEATRTLTAADVEGWDSLTHVRLILATERAFKVKFSAAEIGSVKNVGELIDLIAAKA